MTNNIQLNETRISGLNAKIEISQLFRTIKGIVHQQIAEGK